MSDLYSMTGFAQVSTARATYTFRSYNHKFLDLNMILPPILAPMERDLRNLIGDKVQRGKVLFAISLIPEDPNLFPRLNKAYLRHIRAEWKGVFPDDPELPRTLLESDFMFLPAEALKDELARDIQATAAQCLDAFLLSRREEGRKLLPSLLASVREIQGLLREFEPKLGQARQELLTKLRTQLCALLAEGPSDPGRIEQEAALICSKMDPEEETVRATQFAQRLEEALLKPPRPAGKLLDFLVQELARELQTLSQKVKDFAIREDVVRLKLLTERIREQIQNIE
jgi:uncharacterized protein (TIGR00255 family)